VSGELALRGVTQTALILPDDLPLEAWEQTGETLGRVDSARQWWIGDWLNYGEWRYGEKYAQGMDATGLDYSTLNSYRWVCERIENVRRRTNLSFGHHEAVAAFDAADQDEWLDRAEAKGWSVYELRKQIRNRAAVDPPPPPEGTYRTLVIDPPWPVEKILREVRPKQGPALEYPVMQLDEIGELPVSALADPEGCHIYLWVTHKFLPAGLDLFERWGVAYQCQLTWIKNVGITPFSWMYDTEHVLFGRVGSLDLDRKGLRLSIEAATQGHSAKPDEFYERVVQASPEPRLEMFARRAREGFKSWGTEELANAA